MIRVFDTDVSQYALLVAKQVDSGMIGPGKVTARFEELLAEKVGVKHAIATTSGTTALMLALMALRIRFENGFGQVSFPAYGMCAGANAARLLGLEVVIHDVDENCLLPYTPQSTANPAIAIDHNGTLVGLRFAVEDACQALGVPRAGTYGALACFSFSPQKIVTTGQGGAVVTNNDTLAERVRELIDHGANWREDRIHKRIGGNFRFNDVLASLGIPQLERLDELVERRKEIRSWYRERIPVVGGEDGWCVVIRSGQASALMRHLAEHGVEALQPYKPNHWHLPYKTDQSFPNAERAARELVYLPSHLKLTKTDVTTVCDAVEGFNE